MIDARGYFARTYDRSMFHERGIDADFVQGNISYNRSGGTLRGMHFQLPPAQETKLVLCIRGSLYDVIIDLRRDSPTHGQHYGVELSEENGRLMLVPKGFAHGFMTLADDTTALYLVSEYYTPERESGVRHDDPAFGIEWPGPVSVISEKDRNWPLYQP